MRGTWVRYIELWYGDRWIRIGGGALKCAQYKINVIFKKKIFYEISDKFYFFFLKIAWSFWIYFNWIL